jgi:hypothetical protein
MAHSPGVSGTNFVNLSYFPVKGEWSDLVNSALPNHCNGKNIKQMFCSRHSIKTLNVLLGIIRFYATGFLKAKMDQSAAICD